MQGHTRTIASAKDCRNKGVFWVFEHPRNFRQKFDAQKCRLKLIIMTKGSKLFTAYARRSLAALVVTELATYKLT